MNKQYFYLLLILGEKGNLGVTKIEKNHIFLNKKKINIKS